MILSLSLLTAILFLKGEDYVPLTRVVRCSPDKKKFYKNVTLKFSTNYWNEKRDVPVQVTT